LNELVSDLFLLFLTHILSFRTGLSNGYAEVWRRGSHRRLFRFRPHTDTITGIATSNELVWFASNDGVITIWSSEYLCQQTIIAHSTFPVNSLTCVSTDSGDRMWSCSANEKTIKEWDTSSFECLKTHTVHLKPVLLTYTSPYVLVGGEEGDVQMMTPFCDEVARVWKAHNTKISGLIYFRHLNEVWSSSLSKDFQIRCWALKDNTTVPAERTLIPHSNIITSLISVGAHLAISGDKDGVVCVWGSSTKIYPSKLNPKGPLQYVFVLKEMSSRSRVEMLLWLTECQMLWVGNENHYVSLFKSLITIPMNSTDTLSLFQSKLKSQLRWESTPDYFKVTCNVFRVQTDAYALKKPLIGNSTNKSDQMLDDEAETTTTTNFRSIMAHRSLVTHPEIMNNSLPQLPESEKREKKKRSKSSKSEKSDKELKTKSKSKILESEDFQKKKVKKKIRKPVSPDKSTTSIIKENKHKPYVDRFTESEKSVSSSRSAPGNEKLQKGTDKVKRKTKIERRNTSLCDEEKKKVRKSKKTKN
jgi:hypothetical protein